MMGCLLFQKRLPQTGTERSGLFRRSRLSARRAVRASARIASPPRRSRFGRTPLAHIHTGNLRRFEPPQRRRFAYAGTAERPLIPKKAHPHDADAPSENPVHASLRPNGRRGLPTSERIRSIRSIGYAADPMSGRAPPRELSLGVRWRHTSRDLQNGERCRNATLQGSGIGVPGFPVSTPRHRGRSPIRRTRMPPPTDDGRG